MKATEGELSLIKVADRQSLQDAIERAFARWPFANTVPSNKSNVNIQGYHPVRCLCPLPQREMRLGVQAVICS